jgi:hypothetical protein
MLTKRHHLRTLGCFAIQAIITTTALGQPCQPLPSGIISWWAGEGDTKDLVGSNNAFFVTSPSFGLGEVAQGFSFSGSGNYLQIPDSPSLTFTNDFSIELWYKDGGMGAGAYGGLIAKRLASPANAPCNYGVTIIAGSPSTLLVYLLDSNNGNYQSLTYSGLPPAGGFHHLAVTFHQAPADQIVIKAYVDGQSVATSTVPGNLARTTNAAPVTIGASNSTGEFFKGIIDEVSIYGRLLSDSEIAGIYNAGASGKCWNSVPAILTQPLSASVLQGTTVSLKVGAKGASPLSYQWVKDGAPVDGATNSTITFTNAQASQSGSYAVTITNILGSIVSSNATLTVTIPDVCTPAPAGIVSWWPGEGDPTDIVGSNNGVLMNAPGFGPAEVGQGFTFNGNGSFVQIADSPSLSFSSDLSIELWFKDGGLAPGQYGGLIAKRLPFGACNYGMTIIGGSPGTLLVYFFDTQNGNYQDLIYNNVPAAGSFHHLAATFHQASSTQLQLRAFIDGQLVQSNSFSANLARTVDSSPVYIGSSSPGGEFFKGSIDEVSIYGGILSDSQIASIFQSGHGGKCTTPVAAHVFQQPSNQTAVVGQTATLTVGGSGTYPLSYQWTFGGNPISGATNASLILTNVQRIQAGTYSVVVSNAYGFETSSNASLVVNFPPANVQVVNASGRAGEVVTVPVLLIANGNENAAGFSLNFSSSQLTNIGVTLGAGAGGGTLQFNSGSPGTVGILVGLPSGATFAPGTQEIAQVSFISAGSSKTISLPITFGDLPTKRELVDPTPAALAANYIPGQLVLTHSAFEGDVTPRPDGDGSVTVIDWVQLGRYVAGLDSPTNTSEFQRADCAPRATGGDGLLTVSDWVQAGRYAAGLDPLTLAAGPSAPAGGNTVGLLRKEGTSNLRMVTVQGPLLFQGQTATASIELQAQGDENAVGLSLAFDPKVVSYTGALLGSDATSATMDVNANQATSGQLGIILGLPTNASFTPGSRQLVKVSFQAVTTNSIDAAVTLADLPVRREVADTNALPVSASYVNGVISVNPKPSLTISQVKQTISLGWPLWATNYMLQQALETSLPNSTWTNLTASPVTTNNAFGVTLPVGGSVQFYRLQHQ